MIRAYLFALEPTDLQAQAFRSHCGAQRYAYNWCLARIMANWAQRTAEQTYGLTGDQLTPWIDTSAYSLRNAWNRAKAEVAPWWKENSKEVYASGCANLSAAFSNRKAGYARLPRFKTCHRSRLTCRFTTGVFRLGPNCRHIQLPRIGVIRTSESTRKLARKIRSGTARIRSATLSYQRGRWHVSFSVELPDPVRADRTRTGQVVGIDLGIKSLATLSTGRVITNPRQLDLALAELRRIQRRCSRRRGPDRRTRQRPSTRWIKARAHADRIHTRVSAQRRDHLHKLTTHLVARYGTIVIEDLAVANMMRNRRLARHIAGVSWAELRKQLEYKSTDAGARLIVANRWFASSKICSGCSAVKTKLHLSERIYTCTACGLTLDRDLNAARNLAALAADTGELRRELPDGSNVRPGAFARQAVALPREESLATQRCHREVMAR